MASKIIEKIKGNRTRPAEIEGEPVKIRVYSATELKKMIKEIQGGSDEAVAGILSKQFLDDEGKEIFPAEWLLSDECPQCMFIELAETFMQVNSGITKKK